MKKNMIYIVITGVVLPFAAVALYNANRLTTIEIEKTVTIQAPAQQYSLKGANGEVGSQFHWKGSKGDDLGYQQIMLLTPENSVEIQCFIEKPFKAKPTFKYVLNGSEKNTEITQYFKLESSLGDAFFMWLFRVKPEMEATNQRGLELLQKVLEE